MDLSRTITLGVQFTAIVVLIAMIVILIRAIQIEPLFRGRPGGGLMRIIVGVVLGFTVAQTVAVVNVFGILALDFDAADGLHNGFRLLQQIIIVVTCVWAWRKLAKFI